MTGISFLGTGNYASTTYSFKGQSCTTPYFPVVMKKMLGVDRLFVIMTKEAKEKHAAQLSSLIDYEPVMIPSGRTEKEYFEMFEAIIKPVTESSRLSLDVTHGFRTQPMLALAALIYLRYLKNCTVDGVYYGAYDPDHPQESSVFDLSPYLDVIDWTFAIRRFREKGDASDMAVLMKEFHKQTHIQQSDYKSKELHNTGVHLQQMMQALSVIRPAEVMEEAQYLKERLQDVQHDLKQVYQTKPLALMLDIVRSTIEKFDAGDAQNLFGREGIKMQMTMIRHSLEVGRIQQAFTLCTELLFSVACIKKGIDPLDDKMRPEMSRRLTAIGNGLEAVHQPFEEWEKVLGEIIKKATEYRNDLNHAGMRKEPKPSKNMIKMAENIEENTRTFLDSYFF